MYEDPGLYTVSLAITSPIGCTTDTVFQDLILMEPAPTAGFSFSPESLTNFDPLVQVTDESMDGYRWFYNFNGEVTTVQQNPAYAFRDTGQAFITQVVTHPSGCLDSLTQFIDIKPEITFKLPFLTVEIIFPSLFFGSYINVSITTSESEPIVNVVWSKRSSCVPEFAPDKIVSPK